MIMKNLVLACLVGVFSGCALTQDGVQSEEMYVRASALTKLSTAVESMVRYKNPSASWTDSELLTAATAHDPQLLSNLSPYKLLVLTQNRHAVVLLCTTSGDRALLEDAGCTGQLDRHHWQSQYVPCAFTVSAVQVCDAK